MSWLNEVSQSFQLQQETLFLALSLFDRFMSLSSQVVPTQSLQVIAVACASLASKQCELYAQPPSSWVEISLNAFSVTVLVQIEWLVMTTLKWTCMTPSVYTFLHLYCHALGDCPAQTIALASYLMELASLEYSLLEFPAPVVAAAGLLLAQL
jgi:hypothetical protein